MDECSMEKIKDNLKKNPFYKESNKKLLSEIKIAGHLKSKTPYIPIKSIVIENSSEFSSHFNDIVQLTQKHFDQNAT